MQMAIRVARVPNAMSPDAHAMLPVASALGRGRRIIVTTISRGRYMIDVMVGNLHVRENFTFTGSLKDAKAEGIRVARPGPIRT